MTEQEQKAFTAMREALESSAVCIQLMSDGPSRASWGDTLDIIDAALTAANAVSAKSRSRKQNFNLTPTQLQMIGAGEMDDPRDQRPQATEPVGINGLTESETNATMSVMGLSKKNKPTSYERKCFNDWKNS